MTTSGIYSLLNLRRNVLLAFQLSFPRNTYAKKDSGSKLSVTLLIEVMCEIYIKKLRLLYFRR